MSVLTSSTQCARKISPRTSLPVRFLSSAPQARRPSPYRLLQPQAFFAAFAPLHVRGWRLESLKSGTQLSEEGNLDDTIEAQLYKGDLQGRRLVRVFEMGEGKEGWRRVGEFLRMAGTAVEEQDHHPTIHISPLSDYAPPSPTLIFPQSQSDYIIELSTHTHTPLPPYPQPTKGGAKMSPGVTSKDVALAERVEGIYEQVVGSAVEVKREHEGL
ncbi:hypothetical protein L198_04661 [Cryptococcus wingfieldii CBS 7118]|uniref:Uncharacterized protein n=1 Tax=Cryptococcus wingfieldii CBS 7118 TaxID=1295528 RepID=A0A1E3J5P9_9TREE|nr:hypothetical protein L198_04661 [Cryptococcus wingfieldii CBS 7118]ODN95271.1 hypothetical protein L198_04661 [Cryptococcus wingfieldii CBS 7118]